MVIEVGKGTGPSLRDPAEFTSFSVALTEQLTASERESALSRVGLADSEHVWIAPELITSLAGDCADDAQWQAEFDRMLSFAREHGWVNAAGRIRAHVQDPG